MCEEGAVAANDVGSSHNGSDSHGGILRESGGACRCRIQEAEGSIPPRKSFVHSVTDGVGIAGVADIAACSGHTSREALVAARRLETTQ
jgi:hypothetical protein